MVLLTNLLYASACLLHLWFYDDDIAQCVLKCLQKSWNFLDTELVPASHAILLGSPYSKK